MNEPIDGGPAFPSERGNVPEDENHGHNRGMSKRELFAAILMHSEAVTCGVPGEACEALVQASQEAGTDVIYHMAMNAVHGADALLRALGAPQPKQHRVLLASEQYLLEAAEEGRAVLYALRRDPAFNALPAELRDRLSKAVVAFEEADVPF